MKHFVSRYAQILISALLIALGEQKSFSGLMDEVNFFQVVPCEDFDSDDDEMFTKRSCFTSIKNQFNDLAIVNRILDAQDEPIDTLQSHMTP